MPNSVAGDRLRAARAAGSLKPADVGWGRLVAALDVEQLQVADAQYDVTAAKPWLKWTLSLRGVAWEARLEGEDGTSGEPFYVLTLSAPTETTLDALFPGLPPSLTDDPANPASLLRVRPSEVGKLRVRDTVITLTEPAGPGELIPRLRAALVLAESRLATYADYLGTGPLLLSGTARFGGRGDAPPLLNLEASGTGSFTAASVDFGPVGLLLCTDTTDDNVASEPDAEDGADNADGSVELSMPNYASTIFLYADVIIGQEDAVRLRAQLLAGPYVWRFESLLRRPLNVSSALRMMSAFLPGENPQQLTLPRGLAPLDQFGLTRMTLGMTPVSRGTAPEILYVGGELSSTAPWDLPLPFVRIEQVGLGITYYPGMGFPTGEIWGRLRLGEKNSPTAIRTLPANVTLGVSIPDLRAHARLDEPLAIPLADYLKIYFPEPIGSFGADLKVSDFDLVADLRRRSLLTEVGVTGIWSIPAGPVTFGLDEVRFRVIADQNGVEGSIEAVTSVRKERNGPVLVELMTSAAYLGDSEWVFETRLMRPLKLTELVSTFTNWTPQRWLPDLRVVQFAARYSTARGHPFRISGELAAYWPTEVLGTSVRIGFGIRIVRRVTGSAPEGSTEVPTVMEGALTFSLAINNFTIAGGLSLANQDPTWSFAIGWNGVRLMAAVKYIGEEGKRHQVLAVRMGGVTLGAIVEHFVRLANPNANFRLAPPWDFLNAIDLASFELLLDRANSSIQLTYDVNAELGFASIRKVGLVYDRSSGQGSVRFVLEGSMLGTHYSGDRALEWDAVKGDPPSVPGKGQALFDLRFLGMGQHIAMMQPEPPSSGVGGAVAALKRTMAEPTDPGPLALGGMRFDASRQWLFGLDCTIMDTVALKLILRDPDLYGLLIELSGARAASFAGLKFELSYRKVTADIGVFHARLQIPEAFRQLQLGAASFTLGVISVDIFTNGNFKIDLGFPHNRDFTSSFAVEVTYFNGQGGIYLGLLDDATSDRIPRITNGTFSPVLELGIGLSIGAGRTFRKGVLNATLTANVVGIFEGVLAWFNPRDRSDTPALYYWARGTVGVVGKLQGKVDLSVVSILVTLEVGAYATLTLEAYRPTVLLLEVEATVEASVKVLFIKLHFSYDIRLSASFEFATGGQAPWRLAAGQSGRADMSALADAYSAPRRHEETFADLTRAAFTLARIEAAPRRQADATEPSGWHLDFETGPVFAEIRTVPLLLVPVFTIANVAITPWTADEAEGEAAFQTGSAVNSAPDYRVAFLFTAETAIAPEARAVADTLVQTVDASAHAETPADAPFAVLTEAIFVWTLAAAGLRAPTQGQGPVVTRGSLLEILDQLALPEALDRGFSFASIEQFLAQNLRLVLSAAPLSDEVRDRSGAPFPLPPVLKWRWYDPLVEPTGAHERDFTKFRVISPDYHAQIRRYFADLDPRPEREQEPPRTRDIGANAIAETLASTVFRDYFLLLAKAAVQAMSDHLSSFPVEPKNADTLGTLAGRFPMVTASWVGVAGATLDTVAGDFGVSVAELKTLNPGLAVPQPGQRVTVKLGVSAQSLAANAAAWPVKPGLLVPIGDRIVEATVGDTFDAIAGRYLVEDRQAWLAGEVAQSPGLLEAGARIPMDGFVYPDPVELDPITAAARVYVRLGHALDPDLVQRAAWYAGAIRSLNPKFENIEEAPEILVPVAYEEMETPHIWQIRRGDTIDSIAAALVAAYDADAQSEFAVWRAAFEGANPGGRLRRLPPGSTALIVPGDTLALLAERLLLPLNGRAFAALAGAAAILRPLARVLVRGARFETQAGSLLDNAQAASLSLEAFATCAQDLPGLLAPQTGETLLVRDVPGLDLAQLVERLHHPRPAASIAGQVSRFMLNGVRLPTPPLDPADGASDLGKIAGLYELIGQQLSGPAPSGEPSSTPRMMLEVEAAAELAWLQFADVRLTAPGERLDSSINDAMLERNPGLASSAATDGSLPPGMLVLAEPAARLVVRISEADLGRYPAATLKPLWIGAGPRALPAFRELAVRHPVTHPIRWSTSTRPDLPMEAVGQPGLWLLSDSLMATASSGATDYGYRLVQTVGATTNAPETPLAAWSWATLIDVVVQRIPGAGDTLELIGADPADRQRLADLLVHLGMLSGEAQPPAAQRSADRPKLNLAWTLSPGAGTQAGLTTMPFDLEQSFLIKANLSTETRSGVLRAGLDAPASDYFASLAPDDVAQFLTLVWECSTVGGHGYWLRLATTAGHPVLSEAAFDQNGRAVLTLVIQLESQTCATPDRKLHRFQNAALVGEAVDPASVSLHAVAELGGPMQRQAVLAPGEIGFALELTPPPESDAETPDGRARRLYSIAGYALDEDPAKREGLPLAPQVGRSLDGCVDGTRWSMVRTVPIHRFRKSALPDMPGYPPAAADPYAGTGAGGEPAKVRIWFNDLLGNRTAESAGAQLHVPLCYRDALIGPGSWPATTLAYEVLGNGVEQPRLSAAVSFNPGGFQPGAESPPSQTNQAAERQAAAFADIWYQLGQPGVSASLTTSLQPEGEPSVPASVDVRRLRDYAAAGYIYARACATGRDVFATGGAEGSETAASLRQRCGTDFGALASANASRKVTELFLQRELRVPRFAVSDEKLTAAQLRSPAAAAAALLAEPYNQRLPLRAGAVLATDVRYVRIAPLASPDDLTDSLTVLLEQLGTTIDDFAEHNAAVAGLLTPGARFKWNSFLVDVADSGPASDTTLKKVRDAIAAQVVAGLGSDAAQPSVVDVLRANARTLGLLRAGEIIAVCGYRAQTGDTLESVARALNDASLPARNVETVGLFAPGAPILVETAIEVAAPKTLERFAQEKGLRPVDLFVFNANAPLGVGAIVLPGRAEWPTDLRMAYVVQASDTLGAIARRTIAASAAALVAANARVPEIVLAGFSISVGGQSIVVDEGDTLDRLADRCGVGLDVLANAIADVDGALRPGALLIVPLARDTSGSPCKPVTIASAWGVPAAKLLAANLATQRFLLPGVILRAGSGDATEVVAPDDTLSAVLGRLAGRGITTSVERFARANQETPIIRAGAQFLVPPADAVLDTELRIRASSRLLPIFPIRAGLRITRPAALCADAEAARVVEVALPPLRLAGDAGSSQEATSLAPFAKRLERAIPRLRVATGKTEAEPDTELWAVSFGEGGLDAPGVGPGCDVPGLGRQPRSFALRPLATALQDRDNVPVYDLAADGSLKPAGAKNFRGVDLELWATSFLADLERVLAHDTATAAYQASPAALDTLLNAKQRLAQTIPDGVALVLADVSGGEDALAAARKALRQSLLASLTDGYAAAAVIQFDTGVRSPWHDHVTAPRLVGSFQQAGDGKLAVNLTDPKLALVDGQGFLTSVLTVPDLHRQEHVALELRYPVGELEFNRRERLHVSGQEPGEGYMSSNWLGFVHPFPMKVDLGTALVPLPLRTYPQEPVLTAQGAVPAAVRSVADAARWHYSVQFRHQTADQDRITIQVEFNGLHDLVAAGAAAQDDLFAALARYATVAEPLRSMLAGLTADPPRTGVAAALGSFAQLAGAVATAWDRYWPEPTAMPFATVSGSTTGAPVVRRIAWYATLQNDAGKLTTLTLIRDPAATEDAWPEIVCTPGLARSVSLVRDAEQTTELSAIYTLAADDVGTIDAHVPMDWSFTFPGLSITAAQSARAAVSVDRNSKLIESVAVGTNPSFIYQTIPVRFPAAVKPTCRVEEQITLPAWPARPLERVFVDLLGTAAQTVTVSMSAAYGYYLGDGDDPLELLIPVLLLPARVPDANIVATVCEALDDWIAARAPSERGGFWQFSISLFSAEASGPPQPLLEIVKLRSYLRDRLAPPLVDSISYEPGELTLRFADVPGATAYEVVFDLPDQPTEPPIVAGAALEGGKWTSRLKRAFADGEVWRARVRGIAAGEAGDWSSDGDAARIAILKVPESQVDVLLDSEGAAIEFGFAALSAGLAIEVRLVRTSGDTLVQVAQPHSPIRIATGCLSGEAAAWVRVVADRRAGRWTKTPPLTLPGFASPTSLTAAIEGGLLTVSFDSVAGASHYEAEWLDASSAPLSPPIVWTDTASPLSIPLDRLPASAAAGSVRVRALVIAPLSEGLLP